jgi:hypothetical protein
MAWCRPTRSVAHAIGVFISHENTMMTAKTTSDHAPEGGTIRAASDADRRVTVARAQAELIDMLARLVLAAVESESAASHMQRPRVRTRGRRSRKPDV